MALPGSGAAYAAALVETVAFLSTSRTGVPLGSSGGGQARQLKRTTEYSAEPCAECGAAPGADHAAWCLATEDDDDGDGDQD